MSKSPVVPVRIPVKLLAALDNARAMEIVASGEVLCRSGFILRAIRNEVARVYAPALVQRGVRLDGKRRRQKPRAAGA